MRKFFWKGHRINMVNDARGNKVSRIDAYVHIRHFGNPEKIAEVRLEGDSLVFKANPIPEVESWMDEEGWRRLERAMKEYFVDIKENRERYRKEQEERYALPPDYTPISEEDAAELYG